MKVETGALGSSCRTAYTNRNINIIHDTASVEFRHSRMHEPSAEIGKRFTSDCSGVPRIVEVQERREQEPKASRVWNGEGCPAGES